MSIFVLLQALSQLSQSAWEVTSAAHAISSCHPIPVALFHPWTSLTSNITTNLAVLLFSLIRQHRTVFLMGTGADLTSTPGSGWLHFNPEPWHAEEYSDVSLRCSAQSPQHKIWGLKGQCISVFQHYPISLWQEQRTEHTGGGGAYVLFDTWYVSLGTLPFLMVLCVQTVSSLRNEIALL